MQKVGERVNACLVLSRPCVLSRYILSNLMQRRIFVEFDEFSLNKISIKVSFEIANYYEKFVKKIDLSLEISRS